MIKEIRKYDYPRAVEIYLECFTDDPLHILAFPELNERLRLTKLIYEFIVYKLVPEMKMKIYGYFEDSEPAGVITFSPHEPDRKWNDNLQNALDEMKVKANDKRINLIGEFAQLSGNIKLPFNYFYANELAVSREYRRKGIGRKLMERVESDALKSGINYIVLDTTSEDNFMLYKKWDYELFQIYFFKELKCYKMFKNCKPEIIIK